MSAPSLARAALNATGYWLARAATDPAPTPAEPMAGAPGVVTGNGATGSAGVFTWANALNEATNANTATELGYSDWRLPALSELITLVNPSQAGSPKIDPAFFPNTVSYWYWSATEFAAAPANAWDVGFHNGFVGLGNKTFFSRVRLVRGGQGFDPSLPPVQSLAAAEQVGGAHFSAALAAPDSNKGEAIPAGATGRWLVCAAGAATPTQSELIAGSVGGQNLAAGSSSTFDAAHAQSFDVTGLAPGAYVLYYAVDNGGSGTGQRINQMQMLAFNPLAASAAVPALDPRALLLLIGAIAGLALWRSCRE